MVLGTLNSDLATWQVTIFTSSLAVTAMRMSASAAPAFLKRFGIGAMALNGPDVKRVTDALHQSGGAVDNDHVDPLPCKMLGNALPHLSGPTDNDFHIRSLNPVQAWLLA